MSKNCDAIIIIRIFGQFGAVQRPDSGHKVCKSYFSTNNNLLLWENWKQTYEIFGTALTQLLWVKVLFLDKKR